MVKLDYKKWRAELDAAMEKKDAATVTRLHIIRAQIRGKQHRNRARLDWNTLSTLKKMSREDALKLAENGGTAVAPLTRHDESVLLNDVWKGYVVITQPVRTHIPKEGFIATLKRIFGGVHRV